MGGQRVREKARKGQEMKRGEKEDSSEMEEAGGSLRATAQVNQKKTEGIVNTNLGTGKRKGGCEGGHKRRREKVEKKSSKKEDQKKEIMSWYFWEL